MNDNKHSNSSDPKTQVKKTDFFSSITYFFGKFVVSQERTKETSKVFVGREGQRIFLIDALINSGKRAAFLITGRRGAGKTTFVDHCLSVYEQNIVQRFLISDTGRSTLNKFVYTMIWLIIVISLVFISHLVNTLYKIVSVVSEFDQEYFLWILIIPLSLILVSIVVPLLSILKKSWIAIGDYRIKKLFLSKEKQEETTGSSPKRFNLWEALIIYPLYALLVGCFFLYVNTPVISIIIDTAVIIYNHLPREVIALPFLFGLTVSFFVLLNYSKKLIKQNDSPSLYNLFCLRFSIIGALMVLGFFIGIILLSFLKLNNILPIVNFFVEILKCIAVYLKNYDDSFLKNYYENISVFSTIILLWFLGLAISLIHLQFFMKYFRRFPKSLGISYRDKKDLVNDFFLDNTLPGMMISYWKPTLIMRINLGFENLDHRSVLHAMLQGMRDQYANKFCKPTSVHSFSLAFMGIIIVYIFVYLFSTVFFDLPDPKNEPCQYAINKQTGVLSLPKSNDCAMVYFQQKTRIKQEGDTHHKYTADPDSIFNNFHHHIPQIDYCSYLSLAENRKENHHILPNLLCNISGQSANALLSLLYLELVPILMKATDTRSIKFIKMMMHTNYGLPQITQISSKKATTVDLENSLASYTVQISQPKTISFRVHHLLSFFLCFLFLYWLNKKFSPFPYRRNLRQIDELLEGLLYRSSKQRFKQHWAPIQNIKSLFGHSENSEIATDEFDPRIIELKFIKLLEEIQQVRIPLPFHQGFRLPTPEITFVFDELDKISGTTDARDSVMNASAREVQLTDAIDERNIAIHNLFSDMKRLITTSSARFIFIGNRSLHDEWIADTTRRLPLLTSIFNQEIYIPSLLVDKPQVNDVVGKNDKMNPIISHRIWAVINALYLASNKYAEQKQRSQRFKFFLFPKSEDDTTHLANYDNHYFNVETFKRLIEDIITEQNKCKDKYKEKHPGSDGNIITTNRFFTSMLLIQFVNFLSFRSIGNSKRLMELITSFIRPAHRFIDKEDKNDILYFNDSEIYRIQLISALYTQLVEEFRSSYVKRDDKYVLTLFYLTDYILRLHQRGFAWNSIENLEDLVDIHRSPDLRNTVDEVIGVLEKRRLHQILNGMYAYRFRSTYAAELKYLSTFSEREMASFNFTLDESQKLKAKYQTMLEKDPSNTNILERLGELYEFDKEYDVARRYYWRAIETHDQTLMHHIDHPEAKFMQQIKNANQHSIYMQSSLNRDILNRILSGHTSAHQDIKIYVPWAAIRIKLMLQIGMTYEQAKDLDNALLFYKSAKQLMWTVIEALNTGLGRGKALFVEIDFKSILKHVNILYQPIFASAWLEEKLEATADTSAVTVERAIDRLCQQIDFLNNYDVIGDKIDEDFKDGNLLTKDSNFALILSEMHDKAGDLYFYKGKQNLPLDEIVKEPKSKDELQDQGYLLQAHYHYSLALHTIRRFVVYRLHSSKWKFNSEYRGEARHPRNTFYLANLPSFVRTSLCSHLSDFIGVILARLDLFKLCHKSQKEMITQAQNQFACKKTQEAFFNWLYEDDKEAGASMSSNTNQNRVFGLLKELWGIWQEGGQNNQRVRPEKTIYFQDSQDSAQPVEKLFLALSLHRLVSKLYEEGGNYSEAKDESLYLVRICSRLISHLSHLHSLKNKGGNYGEETIENETTLKKMVNNLDIDTIEYLMKYIIDVAAEATEDYQRFSLLSKQENIGTEKPVIQPKLKGQEKDYKIEESIAVSMVREVISLYLSTMRILTKNSTKALQESELSSTIKTINITESLNILIKFINTSGLFSAPVINENGLKPEEFSVGNCTNIKIFNANIDRFYHGLELLIQYHRYPMLNRLYCLTELMRNALLKEFYKSQMLSSDRGADSNKPNKAFYSNADNFQLFSQLDDYSSQFNNSILFPSFNIGYTAWTLSGMLDTSDENYKKLRRRGIQEFDKAIQSHTMGSQYYTNIANMYYLYDDFNDRNTHITQSLDMMALSLYEYAIEEMKDPIKN